MGKSLCNGEVSSTFCSKLRVICSPYYITLTHNHSYICKLKERKKQTNKQTNKRNKRKKERKKGKNNLGRYKQKAKHRKRRTPRQRGRQGKLVDQLYGGSYCDHFQDSTVIFSNPKIQATGFSKYFYHLGN